MRKAFTLIELLCVIVILAILAGMASARFGNSIARRRVEAAADRIVADLDMLRGQARLKGAPRSITFSPSGDQYASSQVAAIDDPDATYQVLLAREPYQVDLVSCDFGGDKSLSFDMYGQPDSGGTLLLRGGDWTATITVDSSTGRASWN